jgi:hypothetical protein
MSKKVSIKKIVLSVGDKEISLSLEEAKELRAILDEVFDNNNTIIINPSPVVVIPYTPPVVIQPVIQPYSSPYIVPWSPYYPTVTWQTTYGDNTLYLDAGGLTTSG